jgi:hypothetical protein
LIVATHVWQDVPAPIARGGRFRPRWNSVALFYNLNRAGRPDDYQETTAAAVRDWLDAGDRPASPSLSQFMANYWGTLSYGKMSFGLATPEAAAGPVIPRLDAPGEDPHHYEGLMRQFLDAHAVPVWRAAGSVEREGRRFIPSLVLVHRYWSGAWASTGWVQEVGRQSYEVGRITHLPYDLAFVGEHARVSPSGVPPGRVRVSWGTLAHEYAHNFLDFGDLYSPSGCTGYWDLLGDNSPPGRMSEVCSVHKVRIGWLRFRHTIRGPWFEERALVLRPYTSTGDAIKVVPDPELNPHEYFVLEYRRGTGDELWVPDRGLTERGLLIVHVNERLGVPPTWLNRECPYFDPEFADFSDHGAALWTGWDQLDGALFTGTGGRDRFTDDSRPSSAFYGPRRSGLHIERIGVTDEQVTFRLRIDLRRPPRPGTASALPPGWLCAQGDAAVAGRFTTSQRQVGADVAIHNDRSLALLQHRQGQWFVRARHHLRIGGWPLDAAQSHRSGDFDGDGADELLAQTSQASPRLAILKWGPQGFATRAVAERQVDRWALVPGALSLPARLDGTRHSIVQFVDDRAAVLRLDGNRFTSMVIHQPRIGAWSLRSLDQRSVGRFSQAAVDEIVVRSDNWFGLLRWDGPRRQLQLASIQEGWIDGWNLAPGDRHVVGDFDGDGRHEVFIRSAEWAGLLKWTGNRFALSWIQRGRIANWVGGGAPPAIALRATDRFQTARLFPERDAVLHQAGSALSILSLEDGAMRLRQRLTSPFHGRWTLAPGDRSVVGDFHGVGPDVGDPTADFVQDGIDDIFLHAERGTAMLGVHHVPDARAPNGVRDFFGLTWVSARTLVADA